MPPRDRVKEKGSFDSSITGYVLSGAPTGFASFNATSSGRCVYAATDDAGKWEVGTGTANTTSGGTNVIDAEANDVIDGSSGAGALAFSTGTAVRIMNHFPATAGLNLGGPRGFKIFTTPGTSSWTNPGYVSFILVECIGGGGGGMGSVTAGETGSGGGAGGYCRRLIATSTLGNSQLVSVGSGGAGGSAGGGAAAAGGNTTFGTSTFMTACGGAAGVSGTFNTGLGGSGGTATSGDLNVQGGDGGPSGNFGIAASGVTLSVSDRWAGRGGTGYFGSGGPGIMRSYTNANSVGVCGKPYGSGGAGGNGSTLSGGDGGSGAPGAIIVWEFV